MVNQQLRNCRVVTTRDGIDELGEWQTEDDATDLAEELGALGVYQAVRLEFCRA